MTAGSDQSALVVGLGAQHSLLIARRVRYASVRSGIVSPQITAAGIGEMRPVGGILSAGVASAHADEAPRIDLGFPASTSLFPASGVTGEPASAGRQCEQSPPKTQ